jgi:hypothetical protein
MSVLLAVLPVSAQSSPINFLPMEDAMSAARGVTTGTDKAYKPYREPFNLGNKEHSKSYFDFSSADIFAIILLAGIYLLSVRKKSQSRSVDF